MDYQVVITFIQGVGFPIAMCVAMAWYVKYITDQHRNDTNELNTKHAEEVNSIKEALNNNTIVIQRLCDKLDVDIKVMEEE